MNGKCWNCNEGKAFIFCMSIKFILFVQKFLLVQQLLWGIIFSSIYSSFYHERKVMKVVFSDVYSKIKCWIHHKINNFRLIEWRASFWTEFMFSHKLFSLPSLGNTRISGFFMFSVPSTINDKGTASLNKGLEHSPWIGSRVMQETIGKSKS